MALYPGEVDRRQAIRRAGKAAEATMANSRNHMVAQQQQRLDTEYRMQQLAATAEAEAEIADEDSRRA